jgi:hypothetical protein
VTVSLSQVLYCDIAEPFTLNRNLTLSDDLIGSFARILVVSRIFYTKMSF